MADNSWRFPRGMFFQVISAFLIGFALSGLTNGINGEDYRNIRDKRSLLCMLGLSGLIKEFILESLNDTRKDDTAHLGCTAGCRLKDGILKGLSTLSLERELNVSCKDDNKIVVRSELGMKNASITYKWSQKYLLGLSGSLSMKASNVKFILAVTLNTETEQAKVGNMLVTKLEDFRFKFTGLGPISDVLNRFVNLLYKVWTGLVTKLIERSIKKSVQRALDDISWSLI